MTASPASRSLRRGERALVYGLLGTGTEVVFDGVRRLLHRDTRSGHLRAQTYLWMPPLYGLIAVGFEPVRELVREQPRMVRAAAYAVGILGVEYVTGRFIERAVGVVPWDYRGRSPLQVQGAIRLDYAPLWAAAGLGLERVDDALRRLRVVASS